MKIWVIILATLSGVLAEPPVPSSEYLPANQYRLPQRQYLPPQSRYLPPSTPTAPKYLPPSTSYGTPVQNKVTLKSQYGAPAKSLITPSTSYGAPSSIYGAPISTYGVPGSTFTDQSKVSETPGSIYGIPGTSYEAPSSSYGAPSTSYGALKLANGAPATPSTVYEVPYGKGYEEATEPANYEFEYNVQDAQSGNDFGHREQRQGDVAQGKYFVLLPDGRLQTVEYTADTEGYKPRISYQQVGGGYSGGGYPDSTGTGGYQY